MCFNVFAAAAGALASYVSQGMAVDAENKANAYNYDQASRQAELMNQAALNQQAETDSRNRVEMLRNATSAADKTRAAILENRRAMGAARASAGTSGLMGLPLNILDQSYQSLIGGQATNLASYNKQLNENYFFNSVDTALRAQDITNRSIPMKPYMQKFGAANFWSSVLTGVAGAFGSGGGGGGGLGGAGASGGASGSGGISGSVGDFGAEGSAGAGGAVAFA